MDLVKNCEKSEFKDVLKKYLEEMSTRHNSLKSQLLSKQQINNNLKANTEQAISNDLDTSMTAIDVMLNNVHCQLEGGMDILKTKSGQVKKCNETINVKVEEENKKLHQRFYEMITRDVIALKPYHEVEAAINDLRQKTVCCLEKLQKEEELFKTTLNNRAQDFIQIRDVINMLEPMEEEMKLHTQNLNKTVDEQMKALRLKCIEEANENSNESKELFKDINDLKTQLNIN
ncbi:uncharacterized protein LOC124420507 [Lucilia cuprina]|uniref:uncharacterized protein LOC124420507 n=1 Tax=Lucilia cuprina TaxID=7375 RepID=UPI001F05EF83|nr:uncharacterized protein LOC124420507 [Lucilia cuprina]